MEEMNTSYNFTWIPFFNAMFYSKKYLDIIDVI